VIGWYVHNHGTGHRRRLEAVAPRLGTPVTGMGSGAAAEGVPWLPLARDDTAAHPLDPSAGGALHWSPLGEPGMAARVRAVADWAHEHRARLLVVDVSVEMLLLGRLLGLPTATILMRGRREDRAHALAYDTAGLLLAPWPRESHGPGPQRWLDKTVWTGAFSRYDGRPPPSRLSCRGRRCVLLVVGAGGHEITPAQVVTAMVATPQWHWHLVGDVASRATSQVTHHGHVTDLWPLLHHVDVVAGPCGGALVAEVAAARVPFLALPQPRPFDEQHDQARALSQLGCAAASATWPSPTSWPRLLDDIAATRDSAAAAWAHYSDGEGTQRAAEAIRGQMIT